MKGTDYKRRRNRTTSVWRQRAYSHTRPALFTIYAIFMQNQRAVSQMHRDKWPIVHEVALSVPMGARVS